ncbi:MAG TPA: DUF421 domain-containing protein [Actinobacteria bacterium]|jgi:uncharacterized membrane protein YcaP (DUF421 family)|nr:DUF421 domain-containing protein [Actinomycetota bacterium]HCP61634.1 DUF421 domain-containing protein [Actinomycetota bacterium]
MFHLGTPAVQIVIRAMVVYLAILIGFRIMGKREIGQMTIFDLVLILLIANAVQNAMVGTDTSLDGGLLAAAVLLVLNRLVAAVRIISPATGRLFEGQPTVLVEHGKLLTGQLKKQGLAQEDLEMAMREHGFDKLADIDLAVLETDGSISIVPRSAPSFRTKRRARAIRKH